ncbi:hypothetical protein ATO11_12560 [Pseudaestuariivita atlantica]|uniref:Fumarate lyase N-terminal domain-containing protein n=2 Tax=Pseudaestuariivita atlantica TaxID=1317121 RepID=A0A0L1JP04_9RHOB|nr:hypothetical protein ATO11_12560 [Pseudaestuariivita atlantica]
MLPGITTSEIYASLYGDAEVAACLDDATQVRAMIRVEAALARAEGAVGVVPDEAAARLAEALDGIGIAPGDLAEGAAQAGVVVPALVAALRRGLPDDLAHWVHWGATSQDIVDTAMVLCLRDAMDAIAARLVRVIDGLQRLSNAQAVQVMAGRTRGQVATPVTFGLKAARWAQPLLGAEAGLDALARALFRIQFGGASGAGTAIAPHGPAVGAAMARELGLHDAPPWHTDRSPYLALAAWAQGVAAGLSKCAGDVILLVRSEIAEVTAGAGGGSSTMPQKANPVGAEAIRALAVLCGQAAQGLAGFAAHAEERDGTAWPLDWVYLPQLVVSLGAALRHAEALVTSLDPRPDRMAATLAAHPGVMAEAASFALARHMPRAEAQARVKAALAGETPMAQAFADIDEDWAAVLDPASVIPACRVEATRVFATRQRWSGSWPR